jgi:hypothetical protein
MNNSSNAENVNSKASWEDVESWGLSKGASGEIVPKTAQLKAGALRVLASTLREDEPRSAAYVFEKLDDLARRWTNLNPSNQSDTARTYLARARWCLEMHKQWEADPVRFRFPEAKERPKSLKSDSPKRADRKHQKPEAQEPANDAGGPAPASRAGFRTFPLGDGREVVFSLRTSRPSAS